MCLHTPDYETNLIRSFADDDVDFTTFIQGQKKGPGTGTLSHSLASPHPERLFAQIHFRRIFFLRSLSSSRNSSLPVRCISTLPLDSHPFWCCSGWPARLFLRLLWLSFHLHLLRPENFQCHYCTRFRPGGRHPLPGGPPHIFGSTNRSFAPDVPSSPRSS